MATTTIKAIVKRVYIAENGQTAQEILTEDKRTFHLSGLSYAENAISGDLIILDISEAPNHVTLLGTRYKDYKEKVIFSKDKSNVSPNLQKAPDRHS
jgi:hypothetical protein